MLQEQPKLPKKLEQVREIHELFEIYGPNLENMDPDQLKIIELEVLDCLSKEREGEKCFQKRIC